MSRATITFSMVRGLFPFLLKFYFLCSLFPTFICKSALNIRIKLYQSQLDRGWNYYIFPWNTKYTLPLLRHQSAAQRCLSGAKQRNTHKCYDGTWVFHSHPGCSLAVTLTTPDQGPFTAASLPLVISSRVQPQVPIAEPQTPRPLKQFHLGAITK